MLDRLDTLLFGEGQQTKEDQLDTLLFSGSQQEQAPPLTLPDTQKVAPSPIGLGERLALSFADDAGRERFLKERFQVVQKLPNGKFAVGNDLNNILPIDPEGMFNDVLGDLADIAGVIPPIAGQITGGVLGASAGPAGVIAGGGLGAAGGEAISRAIGSALGVDIRGAQEKAADVAISGAFGAAGEGLGQLLKVTGRGLSSLAKKSLDKAVKSSVQPSKTLQTLAKIFKVTSALPEDDLIIAGTYGFNNTLSQPYNNPQYANTITSKFVRGVIRRNKALGKMVGVGDDWAKANFGSKSLELRPAGTKLLQALSDPAVGIVDDVGRLSRGAFTESADFRTVKQLTDLFFSKNPKTGQLIPKNLKLSQALDFKKRMGKGLESYFKSGRVNPKAEIAIAQYLDDVIGTVSRETTTTGLAGTNNPYVRANQAFRHWKSDLKLLKQNGLDLEDVTGLQKMIRDVDGERVLLSTKITDFARRLEDKSSETRTVFNLIANRIGVKFPGKGVGGTLGTVADELNKWNAAQSFLKTSPNFLRLSAIAGLVGLGQWVAPTTPEGNIRRLGVGVLFGTPAGAKLLLKGGEKIKAGASLQFLRKLIGKKRIDPKLLRALLSQSLDKRRNK